MDKKQAVVVSAVVAAVLVLLAVVYTQFSTGTMPVAQAPSVAAPQQNEQGAPAQVPQQMASPEAPVVSETIPTTVPVAQPKTTTDVAGNIAAQMDNEGKAFDVESQAETSQAQSDSNTLNSIDTTYGQN